MTDFVGNYDAYKALRPDPDSKALFQNRVIGTIKRHSTIGICVAFSQAEYFSAAALPSDGVRALQQSCAADDARRANGLPVPENHLRGIDRATCSRSCG